MFWISIDVINAGLHKLYSLEKKGIQIYDIASLHNNITLNTEGVSSENRKLQVHSAMQPTVAKGF